MTDIVFQSEVMLLGWRETHSGGATVTFLLADPSDLEPFKRMTVARGKIAGQRLACVLAQIDDNDNTVSESITRQDAGGATAEGAGLGSAADSTGPAESVPNELARKLHVDGYFRNPKLWLAMHDSGIYTAQDHYDYLATLVECQFSPKSCSGDVVTHHCNTASAIDGGKRQPEAPQKPLHFYGLRLCHAHHQWAHESLGATRQDKEYMQGCAVAITAERMKVWAKGYMNIDSLRQITQEMLDEFEERIGLLTH